ncbi:hypothetical protein [Acidicapsa ligni]|uniref:hypothetical protein n=1 Tax=Acidicapsa ligni TaxID=542300 RepID=UPI0021E0CD98|nr:hypothetical protein [Acidicapsa ligni]
MFLIKILAVILVVLSSIPLFAQETNVLLAADTHVMPAMITDSADAVDVDVASPKIALSAVSGELLNKLDTKTARVGDSVIVRTRVTVTTADGTTIPQGARLVGRVTEVQAHGAGSVDSRVAIQFNRAELKNGQGLAIRSVIQSVAPPATQITGSSVQADDAGGNTVVRDNHVSGGERTGNPAVGSEGGSVANAATSSASGVRSMADGAVSSSNDRWMKVNTNGSVHLDSVKTVTPGSNVVAHGTAIHGVSLSADAAGSAASSDSASGMFFATKQNIRLDGGTQFVLGVATAASIQ